MQTRNRLKTCKRFKVAFGVIRTQSVKSFHLKKLQFYHDTESQRFFPHVFPENTDVLVKYINK